MRGIKDHYVYDLCAEFRRQNRRFPRLLRYGHLAPTCRLLASPRDPSTCVTSFDRRLATYSDRPNRTILAGYIVPKCPPLGVLF